MALWAGLAAVAAASGAAAELPRSVTLGVSGRPEQAAGNMGVLIERLGPGLAGEKLGLRAGDLILSLNGAAVSDMPRLAGQVAKLRAGMPLTIEIWRDGARRRLSGPALGRPLESYRNGIARYGAVPFRGGLLRDILVTPTGGAKGPMLFLIQGYTCDPVETASAESPHRLLIDGLLARGISTYRIEKPQAGDSQGGPACADIDFDTEMASFEAGWRALTETHGVAPDRIFLLGHSMGGIEAPLLAARVAQPPRGVAAFGTVVRNWQDYLFDVFRLQGFTGAGADPATGEERAEALRGVLHALHAERKTPAEIAAMPDRAALLTEIGWDGGERIAGRHYSFWQGLAGQRLVKAWRDTRSRILSVYGESDVAALGSADHQLIASVANHYRPGTARFIEVPRTGHGMTLDGSMAEVRAGRGAGSGGRPAPFNMELVGLFGDWIEASMREPPVATRDGRAG